MVKGWMIAAPRSGSGKTTVTLGLLRALTRRGIRMGACKCGPDYIDPAFHAVATGRPSFNLDSWTMDGARLDAYWQASSQGAEMMLVEGSMGLFDAVAVPGASGSGASAEIAAYLGLPVLLVVDVSGQSQSAGAVALGCDRFDPQVRIGGVILANVASQRHQALATRGVEQAGLAVLGALPRGGLPALPERHLGLVQASELEDVDGMMDVLADAMEQYLDMEAILSGALPCRASTTSSFGAGVAVPGRRIALASDAAFSFIYPHLLWEWQRAGAEILRFSPLADEAPDPRADVCWLPGGYPELHAEKLAGNQRFFEGLRAFASTRPVHGECGGYMVLGEALVDAEGKAWKMAGLLPVVTSFAKRKLHLGYRALTLGQDSLLGPQGSLLRGHEFHYASIVSQGESSPLGMAQDANGHSLGVLGQQLGRVSGTFFHLIGGRGGA